MQLDPCASTSEAAAISIIRSLLAGLLSSRGTGSKPSNDESAFQSRGADDPRHAVYEDLHHGQLLQQERDNYRSAHLILSLLFEIYRPQSILDVGCGIGTWLTVARELSVTDVFGIDGHWMDKSLIKIPGHLLRACDLEQGFDLDRKFDLAISLEVAEHLSADAAKAFVQSLTRHSEVILFSAAIPFQGGHHHVNEQFPDYWAGLFEMFGYRVVDCIRPSIWNNDSVLWWLRQNILVFAKTDLTVGDGLFAQYVRAGPLSMVHPGVYLAKVREARAAAKAYQHLLESLAAGKPISVQRGMDGTVRLAENEPQATPQH